MVAEVSCIICGTRIWSRSVEGPFRAVYVTEDALLEARLSGTGFRQHPPDPDAHVVSLFPDHGDSDLVKIWLMRTTSRPKPKGSTEPKPTTWGFPFHAGCWRIMEEVCSPGVADMQALFDLCRSFPVQYGAMNWGHQYGGSIDNSYKPFELVRGEIPRFVDRLSWREPANHVDIPEIRRVFDDHGQGHGDFDLDLAMPPQWHTVSRRYQDSFSGLPVEMLQLILTFIPTPDVGNLRLASRIYARIPLHDEFWKSRFSRGHEFDFVFEAARSSSLAVGRWKSIYFSVKALRHKPSVGKRRRIWLLASSLRDLLSGAGEPGCDGIPVGTAHDFDSPLRHVRWVYASRYSWSLTRPDVDFTRGCRLLYERMVAVPDEAAAVFASTIQIHGRRHISGIRIQLKNGRSLSLGYRHFKDEVLLFRCEHGARSITGFCVARDQGGIRGLCVITDTGALSNWAGEYRDIPRRRIVPGSAGRHLIKGLKGGFDAVRLLTFYVATEPQSQGEGDAELSFRDSHTWFPDIPLPHHELLGMEQIRDTIRSEGLPLSTMVFGGIQGHDLEHLAALTVGYHKQSYKLMTLEMSFSDGRPGIRIGVLALDQELQKTDFAINGSGGERIVSVTAFQIDPEELLGFTVTTNRDRTFMMPPRLTTPDSSVSLHDYEHTVTSMQPDGGTIVGFWTRVVGSPSSSSTTPLVRFPVLT